MICCCYNPVLREDNRAIPLASFARTRHNEHMRFHSLFALCLAALGLFPVSAAAHPPPKDDNHDRTIVVRLQKSETPNRIRVRVEYRLEATETTVTFNDMREFKDEVNPLDFRNKAMEFYAEFAKIYAPIYADRLSVLVNKKPSAAFRCVSRKEAMHDEEGKSLGHLRCDFVFESAFEIDPKVKTTFFFRELNYYLESGLIALSLVNETGLAVESKPGSDDPQREIMADIGPADAKVEDSLRASRGIAERVLHRRKAA